eukprot:378667-Rhodomonas_salina.2
MGSVGYEWVWCGLRSAVLISGVSYAMRGAECGGVRAVSKAADRRRVGPRTNQVGKNFRNEGMDATHNPEFTSVELNVFFILVRLAVRFGVVFMQFCRSCLMQADGVWGHSGTKPTPITKT